MDWLASRMMQGQFWWDPFADYLTQMPDAVIERLSAGALDAALDVNEAGKRAAHLAASGSPAAATALLREYLGFSRHIQPPSPAPGYHRGHALQHGIRELPPRCLADAILQAVQNASEFETLRKLTDLATRSTLPQLTKEQRDSFRSLARRLYDMAPEQLPGRAGFRAQMAELLGAAGKPGDAKVVEAWIAQERKRLADEQVERQEKLKAWEASGRKTRFPGRGGITIYWGSYQRALIRLGGPEAAEVFLRELNQPEMFGEAAWGLVHLAEARREEPIDAFGHRPKYAEIYERQRSWEASDKTLTGTIKRHADTIFDAIQRFLPDIGRPNPGLLRLELERAVTALATINDTRARQLLVQLSANKYSQWTVADAFHGLVLRGVVLPGKEVAEALEPFIAEHEKENWNSNEGDWCAVVRCLAVLLFSDNPAVGVERIRRLPPHRRKDYQVREVLELLGACPASEAAELLVELSAVPEIKERYFHELTAALSGNVNERARRGLIHMLDQLSKGELPRAYDTVDPLAKAIVRVAQTDEKVWDEIRSRCKKAGSALERDVLARLLREFGTDDAALALCDLIHDEFPVSSAMERLIEHIAESRIPAGSPGAYYVKPRATTGLSKTLVGTALDDMTRRSSGSELLAVITLHRIERGLPANEPLHPDIEIVRTNPVPWQLWS